MTSGGWADSDRKDFLPPDWWKIRGQVLKRDGWRCRWILPSGARCPRKATDVDHMGDRDDHRLERLRSLCADHHKKVTARQAIAARAAKVKKRPRRTERRPGEL